MKRALLSAILAVMFMSPMAMAEGTAHYFTGKDAAEAISRALVKEGAGDELRVQINGVREEDAFTSQTSAAITADVSDLHLDKAHTRWDATLLMSAGGQNLAPVKLSGRYDEMARIPMLKQRMQNGDIITEEDIVWDEAPASRLRKNTIMDSKSLVGKSPKRMVSAGRPIRLDEITGPTVITKGSQVTLIYKTTTIEIKTLGEAMENGSQGAVIRVRNSASKSVLQGVVEGEGRVRIGSPEDMSARLM